MKRSVWIAIWLLLAAVIALCFVRPHQMVSPGNLITAHSHLQQNCFACHAPLRGASTERCITCHEVSKIGLRTTKGAAIANPTKRPAFHQALIEPDCIACHSDHQPPRMANRSQKRFDHTLLKPEVRTQCETCHTAPRDDLHQGQASRCTTCHQPPHWKPAHFLHDRYFQLDRHHNTRCTTCHLNANYERYTCYGCHEHQPAQIIAKHRKHGITNIENCARCHRSAEEEPDTPDDDKSDGD